MKVSVPGGEEMLRVRRHVLSSWLSRLRRYSYILLFTFGFFSYQFGLLSFPDESSGLADDRRLLANVENEIIDKNVINSVLKEPKQVESNDFVAAVLVFCATRAVAIDNHLKQVLKFRGSGERFPVLVSQDGDSRTVTETINQYVNNSNNVYHIQHKRPSPKVSMTKSDKNYFYISQHYKWALDQAFHEKKYTHVIVTEDDLDIAEDFFSYFANLKPLLEKDDSLWCISAWNDNGGKELTNRKEASRLWRTDFFPGLGWMLSKDLWEEIRQNWPERYWDDWMRKPETRKGRSCIRPEVSRTAHNMRLAGKGSSGGLYKSYLSSITLPDSPIDFSLVDISRLEKVNWDRQMGEWLREAEEVPVGNMPSTFDPEHTYRVVYSNAREWRVLADRFKLMNDIRSGMTRTAYYGVVPFTAHGARVFAVPSWLNIADFGLSPIEAAYDAKWDLQSKFMDFEKTYCKPSRYTGKCDPKSPELREWFRKRNMLKKLDSWGEMIVI